MYNMFLQSNIQNGLIMLTEDQQNQPFFRNDTILKSHYTKLQQDHLKIKVLQLLWCQHTLCPCILLYVKVNAQNKTLVLELVFRLYILKKCISLVTQELHT
uniref:Uncharacterized protein n=1 Tax=Micrurus lemniscatus lemniscatus TaxID=129467 RepID=A0A2D4HAH5_MICLE